jgi:hypothetical protein
MEICRNKVLWEFLSKVEIIKFYHNFEGKTRKLYFILIFCWSSQKSLHNMTLTNNPSRHPDQTYNQHWCGFNRHWDEPNTKTLRRFLCQDFSFFYAQNYSDVQQHTTKSLTTKLFKKFVCCWKSLNWI